MKTPLTKVERLKMIQWLQNDLYGKANAKKTLRNNPRPDATGNRQPGKKSPR